MACSACCFCGCSAAERNLEVVLSSERPVAAGELCIQVGTNGETQRQTVPAIEASSSVRMRFETRGEGARVGIGPCAGGIEAKIYSDYVEPRWTALRIDLSRLPPLTSRSLR